MNLQVLDQLSILSSIQEGPYSLEFIIEESYSGHGVLVAA
jgi:hypothetical protein